MVIRLIVPVMLSALLLFHVTMVPVESSELANTKQLMLRMDTLTVQIQQIQRLIKSRDKQLAQLRKKHNQNMSKSPPITVKHKSVSTKVQKQDQDSTSFLPQLIGQTVQPWNPEGYNQSVTRAKVTYKTNRESKCAEKIAKYKAKYELNPKNEYYIYKLEAWRKDCGVKNKLLNR